MILIVVGVGVIDGKLYAIGGHDGPLVKRSAEMFDPETETWSPIAEMSLCRRNAGWNICFYAPKVPTILSICCLGVITLNNQLYAVGGDDGSSNLVSVEIFNPKTDSWSMMPSCMSIGRSYAGVAVITNNKVLNPSS